MHRSDVENQRSAAACLPEHQVDPNKHLFKSNKTFKEDSDEEVTVLKRKRDHSGQK